MIIILIIAVFLYYNELFLPSKIFVHVLKMVLFIISFTKELKYSMHLSSTKIHPFFLCYLLSILPSKATLCLLSTASHFACPVYTDASLGPGLPSSCLFYWPLRKHFTRHVSWYLVSQWVLVFPCISLFD